MRMAFFSSLLKDKLDPTLSNILIHLVTKLHSKQRSSNTEM